VLEPHSGGGGHGGPVHGADQGAARRGRGGVLPVPAWQSPTTTRGGGGGGADVNTATTAAASSSSSSSSSSSADSSSESRGDEDGDGDVWKPAPLRREFITVRPEKRQSSPSELVLDCLQTPRGTVLPAGGLAPPSPSAESLPLHRQRRHLSLASVDRSHPLRLAPWLQLSTARHWDDFNAALDGMAALSFNALFADTANNIGSRVTGR
jgi:hypothetical protein